MKNLKILDDLNTKIASVLIDSIPKQTIIRARLTMKCAPDGRAFRYTFDYWDSGGKEIWELPAQDACNELYELTQTQWRLTQELGLSRWYKMIVMVERSGSYSIDFEYKDDYREGDLMKQA